MVSMRQTSIKVNLLIKYNSNNNKKIIYTKSTRSCLKIKPKNKCNSYYLKKNMFTYVNLNEQICMIEFIKMRDFLKEIKNRFIYLLKNFCSPKYKQGRRKVKIYY